jgi:hypothetical protein
MGSIKNEMVRIAENFFTSQVQAHRNQSFPYTPNHPVQTTHTPTHQLPRRIYLLLQNSYPIGTYTNPDTADYEMHLCIQADEYESAKQGDDTPMSTNHYEVIESRLNYANINNLGDNK